MGGLQEHACGALRNLSMKREVSQKIGEEGALPYMIGLLRSPDERIQEQVRGRASRSSDALPLLPIRLCCAAACFARPNALFQCLDERGRSLMCVDFAPPVVLNVPRPRDSAGACRGLMGTGMG